MKDLTFIESNGMLNIRVAVIVEHKNKILIQTQGDFDCLIGGRVKLGECSHDAIRREMAEEICYAPTSDDKLQLNFICENFFPWDKIPCHEILFIYRLTLADNSELIARDNFKCGDNDKYIEKWITFDELTKSTILPVFIKDYINTREFRHILIQD